MNHPDVEDERYQEHILQGVSRTFALTIPVLPVPLSRVVSNAYLLCRIADTIEDDRDMPEVEKRRYSEEFIRIVGGSGDTGNFANSLHENLSDSASDDEKDLIKHTPAVIRITHSFNRRQQAALQRCIRIMAEGMTQYQEANVRHGLKDQADMDRYCYFVAGVVGEMLTELFCDYSEAIDKNREQLGILAVSFGQGLQMTNILKDIWDDQARGMCWLPGDVFKLHGTNLAHLNPADSNPAFEMALGQLIGVARSHLANALEYTLLIPAYEKGIRRFCLWALGMAILTLRKINAHRDFSSAREVKISRRSVRATVLVSNCITGNDIFLRGLFSVLTRPLPEYRLPAIFNPSTEAITRT